jgi:hypothetical protein
MNKAKEPPATLSLNKNSKEPERDAYREAALEQDALNYRAETYSAVINALGEQIDPSPKR